MEARPPIPEQSTLSRGGHASGNRPNENVVEAEDVESTSDSEGVEAQDSDVSTDTDAVQNLRTHKHLETRLLRLSPTARPL